MATRGQKTRVGTFVLLSLAVFSGGYYLLSGLQNAGMKGYKMRFEESVLGLYIGSQVSYLGISIGTVDEINVEIENDDYYAEVHILIDTDKLPGKLDGLRTGVRAKLEMVNLAAGTMAIALENPAPGSDLHDPAEYIPTQQSLMGSFTSSSQETMAKVMDLLAETNTALSRVNTEVIDEIGETLRGVNEFTAEATDSLDAAQRDLHLAVQDTRAGLQDFRELAVATTELARNVNEAITEVRAKLDPIDFAESEAEFRTQFVSLSEKLQVMADNLTSSTETVLYDADNVQHELVEVTRGLREAIEVLVEVVRPLRDNPSAIVRGRGQPRGQN